MDNVNWTLVILLTTVGFFTLAAILLLPVYVFLKREEGISQRWTAEAIAQRQRESEGGRTAREGRVSPEAGPSGAGPTGDGGAAPEAEAP